MQPSPRHLIAEARFRGLLDGGGIEQPDGVAYEPDSVVFRWSGPKLAVVLELEPHPRTNGNGAG